MSKLAELLALGLRGEGVEVTLLPWGGGGRSLADRGLGRARQLLAIRRAARAGRPDVLLVQTSHDWACVTRDLALALAVRRSGCKVALQLHGGRADRLTATGSHTFKFATRRLLSLVDGVLVLSSEEQRAFAAFQPRGQVYLVANPFTAAAAARVHTERDVPVVLFVGRLLREKGIFDTIEAFALLRARMPARLLVAGDGPAAAAVADAVREHGLSADVTLAGRLEPDRLGEAYAGADAFVLPTYHPEGFPTVISEAMDAGLPVVTTRTRGNADHLAEGTNALFVPPRAPAALARALEAVLTDRALRERMSAANRAKVAEFAPERVAPAYVAALAEIGS
jgi:glycosyltransferase involved in cell wall biosynthesis